MGRGENDRKLAECLAVLVDPLRSAVVDCLTISPATAGEIADSLGVSVERVRYQLKRLRRAGVVTVKEERRRRGAVEYVYVADSRALMEASAEAAALPLRRHRQYVPQRLRIIFKEALEATQAGAAQGLDDYDICRVPLRLDARGFGDVRRIIETAARDLFDEREKCGVRLEKSGGKIRAATSVLLLLEMPS